VLIDYVLGQGSVILRVKLRQDTTSAKPGNGFTGLTSASSGLRIGTACDGEAASTAYTSAGGTIDTITTLGTYAAPAASHCRFREYDPVSHPGIYEVQLANARFGVSGSKGLLVSITGVTGLSDCDVLVPLRAVNPYDALFGLGSAVIPSTGNISGSLADCLNAARAQGFGAWTLIANGDGTGTLTLYAADGATPVRVFAIDSAAAPTRRT
jgi:hypothetical protein